MERCGWRSIPKKSVKRFKQFKPFERLLLLFRRLLPVLEIHHAARAVVVHPAAGRLPAGFALVGKRAAHKPAFIRTILDLPAGRIIEEFFDAFDADFLGMDQLADTTQPLDVVFRIEPVPTLAGREYQAVLLIEPERLRGRSYELCRHTHCVEGRILVF